MSSTAAQRNPVHPSARHRKWGWNKFISQQEAQPRIQAWIMRWISRIGFAIIGFGLAFFLANILFPLHVDVAWSTTVSDRHGKLLHATLSTDEQWRFPVSVDELHPDFIRAIVYKEDRWYSYHPGVNPLAIARAAARNTLTGRRTSGASTIPMQVARLLEPRPRTVGNKLREMFRALQLDMLYSKDELLGLYASLLPYGGNVQGVAAACRLYLNKDPLQLSPAEIAAFTIIPNRPESLRPDRHPGTLRESRDQWLTRYTHAGIFTEADRLGAVAETPPRQRFPAPQQAPHLVRRLLTEHPNRVRLPTTLDAGMQETAETLLANHVDRWRPYGIANGCVMVLDNAMGDVLAYVGSASFYDDRDGGQVDGLQALRSPGSTLKPWLFALAMDSGLLTPKTPLLDVPVDIAGYRPSNYDKRFRGRVTAEEALALSLNVPAVRVLDAYGIRAFRRRLEEAGQKALQAQRNWLGPAMILGGCGVRPDELAAAYAALANEGRYRQSRYLVDADTSSRRVLGAGSAWAVGRMLTLPERPDLPRGLDRAEGLPRIAWKTGTSYGRRDAWAVGFHRRLTILVWTGNFAGQGVPELTGADVAAPLLFDLFASLAQQGDEDKAAPPGDLRQRFVCTETGLPPGPDCQRQVMDQYLPLISAAQTCRHIQPSWVSPDSSITYCTTCAMPGSYLVQTYPALDPELSAWLIAEGQTLRRPPPHNPACTRVFGGEAPRIASPKEGVVYYRYPGAGRIALRCQAATDVTTVFWYVDGRVVAQGPAAQTAFWDPAPGTYRVTCTDDKGRFRDATITVEGLSGQ